MSVGDWFLESAGERAPFLSLADEPREVRLEKVAYRDLEALDAL